MRQFLPLLQGVGSALLLLLSLFLGVVLTEACSKRSSSRELNVETVSKCPLKVVLPNGSPLELTKHLERSLRGRVATQSREAFAMDLNRVVSRIDWLENKLLEFSRFLRLPIEGLKRRFWPWLK